MSTIRKISVSYRTERDTRRQATADKASAARLQNLQEALRLGAIAMPKMQLPLTARMAEPRAELKTRLGSALGRFTAAGHRMGSQPYELKTFERKPDHSKYGGQLSRGTWA